MPALATLRRCAAVFFGGMLVLGGLGGCVAIDRSSSTAATGDFAPAAPREFRAAWVATVANIDWPSRLGLPVAEQRAEMTAILDRAHALNLNAIILQVRPAADALYPSRIEPWSEYLTGTQGRAPEPYYDPLKEWIAEAHRRGLELHAWFNPYRARHSSAKSELAPTNFAKIHPEAVKTYGDLLWMDPGEPAATRQTLAVIRDVVRRYDVDGIHIDDYFYPYPIKAPGAGPDDPANLDFPDGPSWQRYITGGGKLSRADWRRQNVNRLIEGISSAIHQIKPWVRFGVSPFGLGRPDQRPPGISGFSQYDSLYADAELWLQRGWVDYLSPQLYWPIDQKAQAFGPLLDYWTQQNLAHRHVWPGLFTSSINDTPKSWPAREIVNQIELIRARSAEGGHVHFSMVALMQNRDGVATTLQHGPYAQAALVPVSPWLDATAPRQPALAWRRLPDGTREMRLTIRPAWWGKKVAAFAVWKRYGAQWRFSVQPAAERIIDLAPDRELGTVDAVVVSAVGRLGNESPRATLHVGPTAD
jgi:uncharacterized lipoprotein YddW (UPF0748 family)